MRRLGSLALVIVPILVLAACADKWDMSLTPERGFDPVVTPNDEPNASGENVGIEAIKSRADFEPAIRAALLKAEAMFTPDCSNVGKFEELRAVETSIAAKDTNQVWAVQYALDVCGKTRVRSLLVAFVEGKIVAVSFAPGNTIANPVLAQDVAAQFQLGAAVAMRSAGVECDGPKPIIDTELVSLPEQPVLQWVERWTSRYCDRLYSKVINFTSTETGTTFEIKEAFVP